MITAEIRVNGALIAHLYARNYSSTLTDPEVCLYSWEYYQVGGETRRGVVQHRRSDGHAALLAKVLEEVPA